MFIQNNLVILNFSYVTCLDFEQKQGNRLKLDIFNGFSRKKVEKKQVCNGSVFFFFFFFFFFFGGGGSFDDYLYPNEHIRTGFSFNCNYVPIFFLLCSLAPLYRN